jgi:hypothetical protein
MRRYKTEHHVVIPKKDFDRLMIVAAGDEATPSEVFRRALRRAISAQRATLRSLPVNRPSGQMIDVHIKLTDPTKRDVKRLAADLGVSFAAFARGVLRAYLDERLVEGNGLAKL